MFLNEKSIKLRWEGIFGKVNVLRRTSGETFFCIKLFIKTAVLN